MIDLWPKSAKDEASEAPCSPPLGGWLARRTAALAPTGLSALLALSVVYPSYAACEMLTEPLARAVCDLKAKAGSGYVRIIAKVRSETAHAGEPGSAEREAAVAEAQDLLANTMRAQGVPLAEPIPGQPFVVMELNAQQLGQLIETGLVESIQEDAVGGSFSG